MMLIISVFVLKVTMMILAHANNAATNAQPASWIAATV